jgi:D-3-phosphoglycerate dehydrogenase
MMSGTGKVLIAAPVHDILREGLHAAGYEFLEAPGITQASAAALIRDCVGVVTSTRLQLDKDLIDAAPQLRWIGRMGSGMEVMDVAYAASKGIACLSSPEGNCNAVAEHALGLLLGITKRIAHSAEEVKKGLWLREENRGIELEGRCVGIIGFGHTGRAFAQKLLGFNTRVLAYDIADIEDVPSHVRMCASLEEIWAEGEILSFHVQITPQTHHYLNHAFLEKMQRPFFLLNTSRGAVVEPAALLEGLESGKILGAGLDVWEEEPLEKMSEQSREMFGAALRHPGVIATPHIAGYTHESLRKMSEVLKIKILALDN